MQFKLKEQMAHHQSKEASLLDELRDVQQQLRDVVEMCTGGLKTHDIKKILLIHTVYQTAMV